MPQSIFIPKLYSSLKEGYSRTQFINDLMAGIIVGIVALPLAIAFGIASGVKPEQGIFTAVVAGFIISALSGSRVQIGGPTGAFIVIVFQIIQEFGYNGLAIATFLAGGLLIVMGLARLGGIIKFIPYPVTVGFTTGIALIIFVGQIKDLLGLQIEHVPTEFHLKMISYAKNISQLSWPATCLSIATVAIIWLWPRVTNKIPGSLVAIILTTIIVAFFDIPVATIGARFGEVPNTLPLPHLPEFPEWHELTRLFSPALTIAILAGIESLLSAVVADGMIEGRHRSNMELIAQGAANLVSPLFGGIPATGAIARTATNIKNGGRTPIAGMVHAVTLMLILLFFGKWAVMIPMPTLAGILAVVAWNMSEARLFCKLLNSPRGDVLVLLSTFGLTVFVDLTVAIQVGIVLAALLFMQRMASVTQVGFISREVEDDFSEEDLTEEDPGSLKRRSIPQGVEVFAINGPFFFGAAEKFKNALIRTGNSPKVLILRMRHVSTLDATGLQALEYVCKRSFRNGTKIILSGVHDQPLEVMKKTGFLNMIGQQNIFSEIDPALQRANELI